jgi:hypothetical protein
VYILGDSHAVAFDLRFFAGQGNRPYLFQAVYAPGLNSANCAGDDGELSPLIASALEQRGLLVESGGRLRARHRSDDAVVRHLTALSGRPHDEAPAVAISIGGLDIVHFGVALTDVDDVAMPESLAERDGPLSLPALAGALPFDDAVRAFAERMQPLAQALRDLRSHGFERLALLSLAPPTPRDDAFRNARASLQLPEKPSHATLAWRTKLALVANTVLRTIADETGVVFVDRWSAQVRDGVALPGLLADRMHLSDWAADATALAVIEQLFGVAVPRAERPVCYQAFVEDAGAPGGVRQHTIAEDDFTALRAAPRDALVRLHDLNEAMTTWVERARIARIVNIR